MPGRASKLLIPGLLALLAGCGPGDETHSLDVPAGGPVDMEIRYGDLDEVRASGELRIARQRWAGYDTLSNEGIPLQHYEQLAQRFAASLGLTPRWLEFDDFESMLHAPRQGMADIAIGNISVTDSRAQDMAFSEPLSRSREWLLGYADGEKLGLPAGTAYFETAAAAGMQDVVELPGDMLPDEVFDALVQREFDRTIMDAVTARFLLTGSGAGTPQLLEDMGERPLAWVTRNDAPNLLAALNEFVNEAHLTQSRLQHQLRDWAAVREAGVLRVVTVTGPHTYFLYKGELAGFEYELLQLFAEEFGLLVEVVVAPDREQAVAWLKAGRGDLVAAALTVTEHRQRLGWYFTDPYLKIEEVVVSHAETASVTSLAQLAGRRIALDPTSSHWRTTMEAVPDAELVPIQGTPEQILAEVAEGQHELTVTDSHLLQVAIAQGDALKRGLTLRGEVPIAWVVREEQQALTAALNEFSTRTYRSLDYNLLRAKYYGNERRIKRREAHRVEGAELSPYDETVKTLAAEYGFDWRLLVAQVFQESEFRPQRTSPVGARGLLQVMPRTAGQLGIDPDALFDVEVGLSAGVRYLAWCWERFEDGLPHAERMWFALAAYNAGPGHVRDARRLARELGLEGDVWFGNVEQAMLKLSQPQYARKAVHGYVRGAEPVNYVAEIRERYQAYVDHLATL